MSVEKHAAPRHPKVTTRRSVAWPENSWYPAAKIIVKAAAYATSAQHPATSARMWAPRLANWDRRMSRSARNATKTRARTAPVQQIRMSGETGEGCWVVDTAQGRSTSATKVPNCEICRGEEIRSDGLLSRSIITQKPEER